VEQRLTVYKKRTKKIMLKSAFNLCSTNDPFNGKENVPAKVVEFKEGNIYFAHQ